MYEQLILAMEALGWDPSDEIRIEMAGAQTSGIDVGEDYNKKWQSPIGTVKLNKDAFIVIKNNSRRDLSKTQPMEEFKPQHPYAKVIYESRKDTGDVEEGQPDRRRDAGSSVNEDSTSASEVSNSVE